MKKKRNVLKRNSGFIVGCLLAAGASYFTADAVMTRDLVSLLMEPEEGQTEQGSSASAAEMLETLTPETNPDRTFETDPFTVTASGNVIKGVESEVPQQTEKESEEPDTEGETATEVENPEEGSEDQETDDGTADQGASDADYSEGSDGDGSYSYDDGSYDDSSSYSGDGSYEQPIEIQDPGNGSYSYSDGSGGGSSDGGSASTPEDVILWGISSRYIGEEELYNYDLGQLRLIRNEILALNGRIFESQDLRDYFSQKSWYVPTYSPEEFDANMFYYLNDYEEANLNVILNYEAALGGY